MNAVLRSTLGVALAAALAGCSHGTSSIAPTGSLTNNQSQVSHAQYFGQPFGSAAQVCGAARPGEARCLSYVRTDIPSRVGLSPDTISGYHPADLTAAYNLPTGTEGTGQTIAIVDAFDDPNAESDLGVYRSTFGLPACTTANGCFQKLNEFGQTSPLPPADTTGWSEEVSLDVDMASAICPNCHIILLEGKTNSFIALSIAVNTAARLGANTISNSYGGGEQGTLRFDKYYKHRHSIVTASSGDSGYGPQYPAGSQWVVAVGGTRLTRGGGSRGWTETAWGGAGSGCSAFSSKPTWQTDPLCSMRTIADTSADSDPFTGVAVYDTYKFVHGWAVFGGTSVASPIIAAVYNLAGNASMLDFGHSLYKGNKANKFYDITSGSNGSCGGTYLCTAVPGYDGPTGWGTPNGTGAF
jgi:subtilase family serine protease